MADKVVVDRRGIRLKRTAKLAAGVWMLRRARRMARWNPVGLGVRLAGTALLKGSAKPPRALRRLARG